MRIAFDVSPLSHPPTGVGNYIRGSLAGLLEAAGGAHEIVAFAPTSITGPSRIHDALDGLDVELRTWRLPFSHAVRTAWSVVGQPKAELLLGQFDVLHFSDWMYPAQRSGVRSTMIHDLVPVRFPGMDDETDAGDARPEVPQRSPKLPRRLRQLGLHGW